MKSCRTASDSGIQWRSEVLYPDAGYWQLEEVLYLRDWHALTHTLGHAPARAGWYLPIRQSKGTSIDMIGCLVFLSLFPVFRTSLFYLALALVPHLLRRRSIAAAH